MGGQVHFSEGAPPQDTTDPIEFWGCSGGLTEFPEIKLY